MLQVILAFQFGMQQFILKKQQLREGCWHEASCLCCGEPEVAHARAPLGSEGSRRRGINTGSSEVTEVYARSPVSLVTWIERSLGLKGVKIIVRTVNQSSLSGSLCPAIVCKSCADLGRSRGRRSRRGSSRDD
jgi:hypothetical protein